MAKKALLTIDGTYRKIKKGFLTIDGIYRKVKKAYITIGGVYRPCWSGSGKIEYYGTVEELPFYGAVAASVSTADWAYFLSADGDYIRFYDDSLTYSENQPPELPNMAGTSLNMLVSEGRDEILAEGAIFGGDGDCSGEVWAYRGYYRNSSGELSVARKDLAAARVGDCALFGGGMTGEDTGMVDVVDAFDSSLTLTTIAPLGIARSGLSAASAGNKYALFVGGGPDPSTDAYDVSFTRINVADAGLFAKSAATGTDDYAIFSRFGRTVAYNKSLTLIEADALSDETQMPSAATSVGGFALFGGGFTDNDEYIAVVDIYTDSLTRTTGTPLSKARDELGAATVGNYALFGGGIGYYKGTIDDDFDTVDAYVYMEE